jgi:hypothetical protein
MATTKSPKGKSKIIKGSPKKVNAKKSIVKKVGASLSTNGKKAVDPFAPTKLKLLRPLPSDIDKAKQPPLSV